MFQTFKTKLSNAYGTVRAWFNHAWSIFIARVTAISGLLLAALGSADWSALIQGAQAGLQWTQATTVGLIVFAHGIISELGRRQGTVTLSDGQLIPNQVKEKEEAVKILAPTISKDAKKQQKRKKAEKKAA